MEILISVAAKIAEYLVPLFVRPCTYICSYKTNCENLGNEIQQLEAARDSVRQKVDASKHKGEDIEKNVEKWLINVDKVINEMGKFIEETGKSNHLNLKTRYQRSKKAKRKVKEIAGLKVQGGFEQVSRSTTPVEIWFKDSEGYMELGSRKSILNDILGALRNPKVNKIRVYGMGGIGKTTLVKEVGRQAKEHKLCHKVILVDVSRTPNINRIQGEIMEKLNLECNVQSESLRAGWLYERLQKMSKEFKILIILDDIWGTLDTVAIGIPLGDDNSGCKVLITSRSGDVLSCKMDSERNFFVDTLNETESWSLFEKMAGDCIQHGELKSVATDVAEECAGLPIAIVTVAGALRNKSISEWKDALLQLRELSSRNFTTGIQAEAYSSIELSYNYLESKELKNIFLLIGYTDITDLNSLLILGMGLGLFEGIKKMEDAQNRVRTLVNKLKTSCMLLDDAITYRDFSMHDIVREVAISIASRDQHVFTARNEWLNQWWEDIQDICTTIVLSNVKIGEFPKVLECPQLKLLSIDSHNSIVKIPDDFFMRMGELRVLDFSSMHLLSLPSSLRLRTDLRALCFRYCKLDDIANIGDLKNLEILRLYYCDIKELPEQVSQLTRLRLLDLSKCFKLKVVPRDVISSLSNLEELYMGEFAEWDAEGLNNERRNASLEELKHLSNLTSLQIQIKDVKTLPRDLFFKSLERYEILIGNRWDWDDKRQRSCRALKFDLVNTNICLNEHIMQLKGIEYLSLGGLLDMKNVLYGLDRDGFPQLKYLHVQDNSNLLCVVESTDFVPPNAFPLLESLYLKKLFELEKICCGRVTVDAFSKLKEISVYGCDKLKNIFTFSTAIGLQQLQSIHVYGCQNMEEIFAIRTEDDFNNSDDVIVNQLRSLKLHYLPQLTSFCSKLNPSPMLQQRRDESTTDRQSNEIISESDTFFSQKVTSCCCELKPSSMLRQRRDESTTDRQSNEIISASGIDIFDTFFSQKVVLPNLEDLLLHKIKCEKIWHKQLGGTSCCAKNLTQLIVTNCDELKSIFSSSMVSNLVQLQHLDISDCSLLEEIVAQDGGEESSTKFVFPRVTFFRLWNLKQLRAFYPGLHTSEWPVLEELEIDSLELMEKMFSASDICNIQNSNTQEKQHFFLVEKVFSNLKELEISGKGFTMKWWGQFHKLKVVEMLHDKSTVRPLGLLQRLEKLKLRENSFKEIFLHEQIDEQDRVVLQQLKYLHLEDFHDLQHLWKEESILQNLTSLVVRMCDGLLSLVTPLTAKTLTRLQRMTISRCKMMTEVVANEGGVTKDEIVFNELQILHLQNLESLTTFCSGNYTFNFPSLEDLYVHNCPKMKIFCKGVLKAPRLQRVYINDKKCFGGDLNTTIQYSFKKMNVGSCIEELGESSTQHQE